MMKLQALLGIVFVLLKGYASYAQQGFQSMPSPINNPSSNESMPSLSGNGRTILYAAPMGDYSEPKFCISNQKNGVWSVPEVIPTINTENKKLYTSDYFLSYDGSQIYFSSAKFGGVGGTDIWCASKQGNSWSNPVNLAKPTNSEGNDTDPSISADGRFLFFTRTEAKKTSTGKPCGKIYISQKLSKDNWDTPKLLPAPINMGCECNARLLPDQRSLSFASQRTGGKGGYDQYIAQWNSDGTWAAPKPIVNINTPSDDLYISIPAGGDYVYYTATIKSNTDVVRALLPTELKPSKSMIISATLVLPANTSNAKGSTVVYKNAKSYLVYPNHEGKYFIALNATDDVEITYQSDYKKYFPQIMRYKLDTLSKYKELFQTVTLQPILNNSVYHFSKYIVGNNVATSKNEIAVLTRLIKENVGAKFTIEYLIPTLEMGSKDSTNEGIAKVNDKINSAKNDAEALKNRLVNAQVPAENISVAPIEKIYSNTLPAEYGEGGKDKVLFLKLSRE